MQAVAQGIYQRRGLLRPRKLHQIHIQEHENMMDRMFEGSFVAAKGMEGASKRDFAKKCCYLKNELQKCVPDDNVKRLWKINENVQSFKALPKVSNFLFSKESVINNRGIPHPKFLLGPSQDQESITNKNSNLYNKRVQKLKKYEQESGTTQSTSFEKNMQQDKGIQVTPKDEEQQRRKKKRSKNHMKKAKVVQETKIYSEEELDLTKKIEEQPTRNDILEGQNCQILTNTAKQNGEQQFVSLPQVNPIEKGFQSDQSKDEQQTLQQDHIDGEMRVQTRARDPQSDKVFQLQSQSQRAEGKQQVQSQDLFPLDQEEEKQSLNKWNVNEQKSDNTPNLSEQKSNLFTTATTTNNQQAPSKIQKTENLFPTSLFQKKNIGNQLFQPQEKPTTQQTKAIFSSGWQTSCQKLENNPFVTNWKQGQIQQLQQKHSNSFSLFEGNPFSSLKNNTGSAGQTFIQNNKQKSNSFSFQSKLQQENNNCQNNYNSLSLSQSSIFNRDNQSFEQKCDEEYTFRPIKSFIDNTSSQFVSSNKQMQSILQRQMKQQQSDDQDLFTDCNKNKDSNKRSWSRNRF